MDSSDTVVDDIDRQCSALMISAINASAGNWTEEKPLRRLLESEDSSYDSDYENNDSEQPQQSSVVPNTPRRFSGHHDEVSRTVSETLGQEYEEYLTTSPLPQPTLLDVIINDPNYIKSVEFALKLGYTETQVQIALMKLGPTAGQNELLAELIKLGAGTCNNISVYSGLGKTLVSSLINDTNGDEVLFCDNNDNHNLRPIVIDGSNVAISHGNKECFSCMGIKICVEWFQARGHREITVFVPMWRKEVARPDAPIKDQEVLSRLESERLLVFTPSRNVGGRRMVCYDDRYILKLAAQNDGIVVSNDNYRDLLNENPEYKKVVEDRLLMYSFVNDRFMPPDDPLGRKGPSLNNFLRRRPQPPDVLPPPCPYGKKCTYGNKCKYYHPERGNQPHKSVTERLAEQAKIQIQEVKNRGKSRESSPGDSKLKVTHSLPLQMGCDMSRKKLPLSRTQSVKPSKSLPLEDEQTYNQPFLRHVFPDKSHSSDHNKSSENLHRKLQRQLTLNPNYDPRLHALQHGYDHHNRHDVHQSCPPVGTKPSHRQLTRLGSDGPTLTHLQKQHQIQQQSLLYVPHSQYMSAQSQDSLHTLVTRNCSAPDSSSNWPPSYSPSMARLNSTSDTRLNMTPPPAPFPNQIWSTNSGGLIVPPNPSNPWNHSDNSSTLRNSHNALSAPVRPSSVPLNELKQTLVQPTPVRPIRAVSPNVLNDSRRKLYFHLSSIFPEEQVRTAMDLYPEETNPQSICAAILTMFPKKS